MLLHAERCALTEPFLDFSYITCITCTWQLISETLTSKQAWQIPDYQRAHQCSRAAEKAQYLIASKWHILRPDRYGNPGKMGQDAAGFTMGIPSETVPRIYLLLS